MKRLLVSILLIITSLSLFFSYAQANPILKLLKPIKLGDTLDIGWKLLAIKRMPEGIGPASGKVFFLFAFPEKKMTVPIFIFPKDSKNPGPYHSRSLTLDNGSTIVGEKNKIDNPPPQVVKLLEYVTSRVKINDQAAPFVKLIAGIRKISRQKNWFNRTFCIYAKKRSSYTAKGSFSVGKLVFFIVIMVLIASLTIIWNTSSKKKQD